MFTVSESESIGLVENNGKSIGNLRCYAIRLLSAMSIGVVKERRRQMISRGDLLRIILRGGVG